MSMRDSLTVPLVFSLCAMVSTSWAQSEPSAATNAPAPAQSNDSSGSAAPTAPESSASGVITEQVEVEGTNIRAGKVTTEFNAPLAIVTETLTDFAHYNEFLPQVRESRVVQRRRGQADVYLNIPLLNNLGVMWVLARFNVQRSPGQLVISGSMVQGNFERFEFKLEATEIAGTGRTRVVMTALGTPTFPFPDAIVNRSQMYWAGRGLVAFRQRAEQRAAAPRATGGGR
jgi:ribosome-associated toxin RatA of RatAB toxin-antitoxin module